MEIREMTIDDYEQVYALWMRIKGFAIRSIDDSYDGIARFLKRNPSSKDMITMINLLKSQKF